MTVANGADAMQVARFLLAAVIAAALPGCKSEEFASPGKGRLSQPDISMEADPPPPFTYWAPAGSTIRNHPREPEVWIAETDGGSKRYYYGDRCRASAYQHLVGRPTDALPEKPAGVVWREACTSCAVQSDLNRVRMNISYDENIGIIEAISCG